MSDPNSELSPYVEAIRASGLSIYDPIEMGDPTLWIPTPELQSILNDGLQGISLSGFPIRTRSKVVKETVCRVLGYPVPLTFKKTRPRFPGQLFDTYVQKTHNLQVWNEPLFANRRYVLIRVSRENVITHVRVVTGETLASLSTTGTLTQKYQARCIPTDQPSELVTPLDAVLLEPFTRSGVLLSEAATPVSPPMVGQLLSIGGLFERLKGLIGAQFKDSGVDQERNRGAGLHQLVCAAIRYAECQDDGQFPDIRHQLLEVKLQTSQTIELGLVRPTSTDLLGGAVMGGQHVRHCDVRYAVFYARTDGSQVTLTHLSLVTREAFFTRFPQSQGNVLNRKRQLQLPTNFWD